MRVRVLAGTVALVLIGAGCSSGSNKSSSTPAAVGSLGIASLNPTGSIGVVAEGTAKQEVRADLAFLVISEGNGSTPTIGGITIGPNGQPISTPATSTPSTSDHDTIRAAVRPLGIAGAAVEFSLSDPSGALGSLSSETMQIEVPVAKLPQIANAVVAAVKKAGVTVGSQGLRFAVQDCTGALSTARDKAIADARTHAQGLAIAAGVTLGELTSVAESPQSGTLSYLSSGGEAPCGRSSVSALSSIQNALTTPLATLGAKPTVELTEAVAVTYALGATAARTISATGDGEVTGPADAADIFVEPQPGLSGGPIPQPTTIDETRVLGALTPIGVARSRVEVENPPVVGQFSSTGTSYVRVHVTIPQLKSEGVKIVAALESIVGSGATSGAVFSSSTCDALTARARADAARDAETRLDKLAVSAKAHLGAVVGVAEADSTLLIPQVDSCKPDFSSLTGLASVEQLLSSASGSGSTTLGPLDALPQVTEQVSLSMTKAMT